MIRFRILFKSHIDRKFIAFTLDEVFEVLSELDSSNIVSIHIYPDTNDE